MIDVHTHYVPPGWPDPTGGSGWLPWLRIESDSEAVIMMASREFRRIRSNCWDAEIRPSGWAAWTMPGGVGSMPWDLRPITRLPPPAPRRRRAVH